MGDLLYLSYLVTSAFREIRAKPSYSRRIIFFTLLNICLIIICVAFAILRFGKKMLQDNFVASLEVSFNNSAEFVCLYGLINLYVYTLAFVYSPSIEESTDPTINTDSGFTILNVYDEEVDLAYCDTNDSHDMVRATATTTLIDNPA